MLCFLVIFWIVVINLMTTNSNLNIRVNNFSSVAIITFGSEIKSESRVWKRKFYHSEFFLFVEVCLHLYLCNWPWNMLTRQNFYGQFHGRKSFFVKAISIFWGILKVWIPEIPAKWRLKKWCFQLWSFELLNTWASKCNHIHHFRQTLLDSKDFVCHPFDSWVQL